VQADDLDEPRDLRLRPVEMQLAVAPAEPASEHEEVEHQRRVGEVELSEVDLHVGTATQCSSDGATAAALGRPVLIPPAPQYGDIFVERDDGRRVSKTAEFKSKMSQDESVLSVTLMSMSAPDPDAITEALANVIDPELGLDFVELGLVYGVDVDGSTVKVTFTLTTPACPIGPQVSEQMKEFVGDVEGVEEVLPEMVFQPPWTPDRMSEDAKFALGY
jgi:metal-sulfur cluster biosynthetic enzyme